MISSGPLFREARLRRGLSQKELAGLAGVPQPTISEIETGRRSPTLDVVNRIIRGGRLPLELALVDEAPFGAAATAREVRHRLADPNRESVTREDGALRSVIDLRDALHRASSEELGELVADRPVLTGDRKWDAFIAGVVEEVCTSRSQPAPGWTQEASRFVRPFWHLSTLAAFHQWELETAPASLVRHGVLAALGELASA
jgi:transcriptional regulator with XRE-family HTH domain